MCPSARGSDIRETRFYRIARIKQYGRRQYARRFCESGSSCIEVNPALACRRAYVSHTDILKDPASKRPRGNTVVSVR